MVQKPSKYLPLVIPVAVIVLWLVSRGSQNRKSTLLPTPLIVPSSSQVFGQTQTLAPTLPNVPVIPGSPSSLITNPVSPSLPPSPSQPITQPPTITPTPAPQTPIPTPSQWNFARYRAAFPQWFNNATDTPHGVIVGLAGLPINIGFVNVNPHEVVKEIRTRYWNLLDAVAPSDPSYHARIALNRLISDLQKWVGS